jgi:hypothetical protein
MVSFNHILDTALIRDSDDQLEPILDYLWVEP